MSRAPSSLRGRGETVRLKPSDPFDLIRWLARSQGDPRKAVAELVQNALDAGATHITVDRRRIGGAPALCVSDDGEGVLPDRTRERGAPSSRAAHRTLTQGAAHARAAS